MSFVDWLSIPSRFVSGGKAECRTGQTSLPADRRKRWVRQYCRCATWTCSQTAPRDEAHYLDMFAAILETVWGVRVLMSNKRFEDYLLNTKAESGYIDRQWKFVLLQNLRNNVDGWNLLREELKDDLLTILKNGPFYTLSGGLEVKTEQA